MDSNQRYQQAVLGTQCHDNRGHQGGNHDVVGGRRKPHTQNQTDNRCENQHQQQVAAGDELHKLGHHQANACQRHRAHHNAGGGSRHTDTNHIPRASYQREGEVNEAGFCFRKEVTFFAEKRFQWLLSDHDENHKHRGPEC